MQSHDAATSSQHTSPYQLPIHQHAFTNVSEVLNYLGYTSIYSPNTRPMPSELRRSLPATSIQQGTTKKRRPAAQKPLISLQLPQSILPIIISFVTDDIAELTGVIAVVNRAWRAAAMSETVWCRSRYYVESEIYSFDEICLDGLNMLRKIDFDSCMRVSLENLIELNHKCPKLTHLSVKYGDYRYDTQSNVNYPKTLPKEQAPVFLNVVQVDIWEAEVPDDYKLLPIMFPNLGELWLQYADFNEDDFKAFSSLRKLKKLEIELKYPFNGMGWLTQVEHLQLRLCSDKTEEEIVSLRAQFQQMSELRVLRIEYSPSIEHCETWGISYHMLQRSDLVDVPKLERCELEDRSYEFQP